MTTLDLRGLKCPLPVLRTRKALRAMAAGQALAVQCTDPLSRIDVPNLLARTGDRLERVEERDGVLTFHIRKGGAA
jgi:tRNA 2-thiouridine synthesizing protein A